MALQHLTPAQRAILLLREVLEWAAVEVAEWLNLSVPAVNSGLSGHDALCRSATSAHRDPDRSPNLPITIPAYRYVTLWEQADIPGLVVLLRENAWFTMPPISTWFQGRAAIATALRTSIFTPGRQRALLLTRANGSPAFGLYHGRSRKELTSFLAW